MEFALHTRYLFAYNKCTISLHSLLSLSLSWSSKTTHALRKQWFFISKITFHASFSVNLSVTMRKPFFLFPPKPHWTSVTVLSLRADVRISDVQARLKKITRLSFSGQRNLQMMSAFDSAQLQRTICYSAPVGTSPHIQYIKYPFYRFLPLETHPICHWD